MTTVHVSMARDDGTGTLAALPGSLYWEPTTRREDGTVVVLPVGFAMSLVAGEATKDVEPSGLTWCWRVTERVQDGTVRYVSVADSATTLEYVDLPDVDPDTLVAWSPADPEAAYLAALGTEIQDWMDANASAVATSGDYDDLTNRPTFKTVSNRTGATIPAQTLVEIIGAFGIFSTVRVADNTTADHVAGITVAEIADGASGEIQVTGTVEGLTTNDLTAGVPLYLGTSGAWTATRPTAPAHVIRVGVAGVTHPTAGTVVFTLPAFEITADHVDGLDAKVTALAEDSGSALGASLSSTYAPLAAVDITTISLPASPVVGQAYSVLADSTSVIPAGVTWDSGGEPTISSGRLLLTFVWSGNDWVGTYGLPFAAAPAAPDTTDPTPGTLGVVMGSTTADLTVTGATDETALHATPYAYTMDAGVTWTAWQADATYQYTSLTPETEYTFQHKVRDAAENEATGAAVTDSTTAVTADTTPPTVGTLAGSAITSTGFTLTVTGAADETALHADPYGFSTDNGSTYSAYQSSPIYSATGLTAETGYQCKHRVRDAAGNVSEGTAITVTTAAASAAVLTFQGNASSGADSPTDGVYTFASVPIGTASSDRVVVVSVSWNGLPIESVTIGGVVATLDAAYAPPTALRCATAIARAAVPTGETAAVVVNLTDGLSYRCGIGVWTITGATVSVSDTDVIGDVKSASSISRTVTVPTGGGIVIASTYPRGSTGSIAWTGVTEDYDLVSMGGEGVTWSGASEEVAGAGDVTVTATFTGFTTDPTNGGSLAVVVYGVS